ncbi:hypothetical protein DPMN_154059 [Dreissena polymorpha]|uniref:Uncharacterized protein n=1 Tax=Dreissena polymorpha TaxID=45954 RepID=A0A9D4FP85_DREPO|nr:hypothetical protein DPMN_154059 [Dreissena polymorpha]
MYQNTYSLKITPHPVWQLMGASGLVMGPCIVEIDRIVIREVQYQLEVNWCRNEEIIVKGIFGWAWPMWAGCPRVGNGAIHKVQYQFEVNQCNFGWAGRPRVGNGAMHMNRCRNEEIIVKGNFGWAPRIYRNVIREVQYQFEVNQCRNEEIIVKGNFGWAGRPRVGNGAMHKVQYQFKVNRCRNEEIIVKGNFGWAPRIDCIVIRKVHKTAILGGRGLCGRDAPGLVMGPCIVEIDRIVIREVRHQFEDNRCRNEEIILAQTNRPTNQQTGQKQYVPHYSGGGHKNDVGGDSGQDGQTDRRRR